MKLPIVDKSKIERFSEPPKLRLNYDIIGGFVFGIVFYNMLYAIFFI